MRNEAMEQLDVLVGSWQTTMRNGCRPGASRPGGGRHGDGRVARRRVCGLPLDDGGRCRERPTSEMVLVLGSRSHAHDVYTALYQDERGVCRVYAMTFDGSHWNLSREDPDMFQRFIADVGPHRIAGRWEASEDHGSTWRRTSTSSSSGRPHTQLVLARSPVAPGLQVPKDLLAREPAGSAHDASAGVGARSAMVVAVDRGAVLVPAGRRPEEVGLRREELAAKMLPSVNPTVRSMSSGVGSPAAGPGRRTRGRTTPGWPAPCRRTSRARCPSRSPAGGTARTG